MKNLKNKVAVITGAGSGMGRELARVLAKEGTRLALNDWNEKNLKETLNLLPASTEVFHKAFDVSQKKEVYDFAQEVVGHFGQVDIVVNNAGITLETKKVSSIDYESFEKVINVNMWGVIYGSRAYLPHLATRAEASLVNISSIFGIVAQPLQGPYVAAKFAVRGFTETLRNELVKTNIAVTCVHPGGIKTNIVRNIETTNPKRLEKIAKSFDKIAQTSAEQAALKIMQAIQKKKRRLLIGRDALLLDFIARLFPSIYHLYIYRRYDVDKFSMED